jgi:hypothetical protein
VSGSAYCDNYPCRVSNADGALVVRVSWLLVLCSLTACCCKRHTARTPGGFEVLANGCGDDFADWAVVAVSCLGSV